MSPDATPVTTSVLTWLPFFFFLTLKKKEVHGANEPPLWARWGWLKPPPDVATDMASRNKCHNFKCATCPSFPITQVPSVIKKNEAQGAKNKNFKPQGAVRHLTLKIK